MYSLSVGDTTVSFGGCISNLFSPQEVPIIKQKLTTLSTPSFLLGITISCTRTGLVISKNTAPIIFKRFEHLTVLS